jgi:late competence protein required for DNA uptake (superfamily II DNA/RNA helicase)
VVLEVVIYKARGRDGYFYDMSLNPSIDFAVLKSTRNIERLEVITPKIEIDKAEKILKSIYASSIIGKIIPSQDFLINNALRKLKIERIKENIFHKSVLPSPEIILRVENYIMGKVITLQRLFSMEKEIGLGYKRIMDIIQILYCQRRIKMLSSCGNIKGNDVCSYCGKSPCSECYFGFEKKDILLYEAYNYSINIPVYIDYKRRKMQDSLAETYNNILTFTRSKKASAVLWCAPNAFQYEVTAGGIVEVLKRGGKVLYVTSASQVYEVKEALRDIIKGPKIDNTDGFTPDFKLLDISICSYKGYPCFHKAFDLVILDERYSFLDRPLKDILFICQKGVREKGKFINITCSPDKQRKSMLKGSAEIIDLPISTTKNPIPEPRIVTSRFLKGAEAFIPPMAIDVIKWSLGEGSRVIVFVPDDRGLQMVYNYLTSKEGIDKDLIDISYPTNKSSLVNFMKRKSQILISLDFKDAINVIEDVNVIAMYCDNDIYHVDTLVYMASMAVAHMRNNLREVVFVASNETETISLAKSMIRAINKMAWERGYLKR